MATKVTTTGQTTFTAKVRTTGQTTFVKKIVIGTPVRSVTQQGLQLKALSDTEIVNVSNNQIIAFDSALQKFVNRDSATLVNLHSNVISRTSTVDSGVYGSASQVPILTVNQSGFIDSIGTTLVAGVTGTAYDSTAGIFTINTADGQSFPTTLHDSDDRTIAFQSAISAGTGLKYSGGGSFDFSYDGAAYGESSSSNYFADSAGQEDIFFIKNNFAPYAGMNTLVNATTGYSGYISVDWNQNVSLDDSYAGPASALLGTPRRAAKIYIDSSRTDFDPNVLVNPKHLDAFNGLAFNSGSVRSQHLPGLLIKGSAFDPPDSDYYYRVDSDAYYIRAEDVFPESDYPGIGNGTWSSNIGWRFAVSRLKQGNIPGVFSLVATKGIIANTDDIQVDSANIRVMIDSALGEVSVIAGAGLTGGGTINPTKTIDLVGGKGIIANADDVQVDSANIKTIIDSNLANNNITFGSDVILDSAGAVMFDLSDKALEFNSSKYSINLVDYAHVNFGDSQDGYIEHTGSFMRMVNTKGGISIRNEYAGFDVEIRTDDGTGTSTTQYIRADGSTGQVKLYYYGLERLKTTDSGVNISGQLTVDSATFVNITADSGVITDISGSSINYDSATFTTLTRAATVDSATYGTATQVPVITVNTSGFIDSVGTVTVAGVSSVAFDSASFNYTINTADGGTFTKMIHTRKPGLAAGTHGSAVLVPQIKINEYGLVDSIGTNQVAGVTSTSFDSSTGIFTINTADGNSFTTHIQDSADLVRISRAAISAGDGIDVSSGVVSIKTDGIDDTHIDFGTGTNQVSTADIPEQTNLYYTTARADSDAKASLLGGTGVTYDSGSGVISIGQSVGTSDNVTFNSVRGPANFVIDPAAVGDNTGTVQILGNLQVEGTQTTINSTTVSINDKNIVLADSATNAAAADGAGITINGASASLTYAATGDKFVFNKPFQGQYLGFDSNFDSALGTKSTSNLSEGTNLYYTNERVDDRLNDLVIGGTNITVTYNDSDNTLRIDGVSGASGFNLSANDTDDLSEGSSNLYFTNARVQALSVDSAEAQAMVDSNFANNVTFSGDVAVDSAGGFLFDISDKSLEFGDNYKAKFGNSNDLEIYHTGGTSSNIRENGTGNLNIWGDDIRFVNSAGTEIKADFVSNGAVILRHDHAVKIQTTAYGVTVTGSVNADSATFTNITGTLQTAAQPNITSLGTLTGLTSTGDVVITSDGQTTGGACLQIDNTNTSNTFPKAIEAFNANLASGSKHQILLGKAGSTNNTAGMSFYFDTDGSSSNAVQLGLWGSGSSFSVTGGGDVILDSAGAIMFDKSDQALEFGDDYKASFGAGGDLVIRHQKSNNTSYIEEGGTGDLVIKGDDVYIQNAAGTENMAVFVEDAGVQLRFNNATKLQTNLYGATVTGTINADSATFTDNIRADGGNLIMGDEAYSANSNYTGMKTDYMSGVTDYMIVSGLAATSDGNTYISAKLGSSVFINGGGDTSSHKLEVSHLLATAHGDFAFDSAGAILFDNSDKALEVNSSDYSINLVNNAKIKLGNDSDFTIHHDGSNNIIRGTNGHHVWVQTDGNIALTKKNAAEYYAIFYADAQVQLRYNNATKFETTATGIDVTGSVNADSATLTGGISIADQYDLTGDSSRVTSTSASNISFVSASTYTGGKFVITAHDHVTGARQISELLVIRDSAGGTAVGTEYGQIYTNSSIATYTVDVHSGLLRLLATGATTNATTYQVAKTLMKD